MTSLSKRKLVNLIWRVIRSYCNQWKANGKRWTLDKRQTANRQQMANSKWRSLFSLQFRSLLGGVRVENSGNFVVWRHSQSQNQADASFFKKNPQPPFQPSTRLQAQWTAPALSAPWEWSRYGSALQAQRSKLYYNSLTHVSSHTTKEKEFRNLLSSE